VDDHKPTPEPHWKADFPTAWDEDHYVTRRELVKFFTLGSGLLGGASVVIAALGPRPLRVRGPEKRIASFSALAPGASALFRYPSDEDPCILIRQPDGELTAYSQVCTHLSCAIVHRPRENDLLCPCHHGIFAATDGRPIEGPPTRRLPRILLERRGDDVFAIGVEI
jgi:nitrite reductase/ring-hydroxylating ferredoxin subunit